jgi:hypothetical protein
MKQDINRTSALRVLYSLFYSGDLAAKLDLAQRLFRCHRRDLEQDVRVAAGLSALLRRHETLTAQMLAMEMDVLCSCCAQKTGGGCCSLAIAEETDVVQLLMNMLAGVAVSLTVNDGVSCPYLGGKGCIFLFKPFFCLNYLCPKIVSSKRGDALQLLERQTGRLLQAQTAMEGILMDFFAERAPSVRDASDAVACLALPGAAVTEDLCASS